MSNALDGFASNPNPLHDLQQWYDALAATCPNLAALLAGNEHTKVSGPTRPPMSIIFSIKDGKLRFVVSAYECSRQYFGTIDDPSVPWEAAERCLALSQGEWSTKPDKGTRR